MYGHYLVSIGFNFLFLAICWGGFAQESLVVGGEDLVSDIDNLVQGRIYDPEYLYIDGSQFLDDSRQLGNVYLLDNEYKGLLFQYDIFVDALVYYPESRAIVFYPLELTQELISYFTLGNRYFVNLEYSQYKDCGLRFGYYEVLSEGYISQLVDRKIDLLTRDASEYFIRRDVRYFIKDGKYFRVNNKKSVLKVVGREYKKPILTFLKSQSIYLNRASDEEWESTVSFLNTLFQSAL